MSRVRRKPGPALFVLDGKIFEARDSEQKRRLAELPVSHREPVIRHTIATLAYFELGLDLGGLAKWANEHGVPLGDQEMKKIYGDVRGYRKGLRLLGVNDIPATKRELGF